MRYVIVGFERFLMLYHKIRIHYVKYVIYISKLNTRNNEFLGNRYCVHVCTFIYLYIKPLKFLKINIRWKVNRTCRMRRYWDDHVWLLHFDIIITRAPSLQLNNYF